MKNKKKIIPWAIALLSLGGVYLSGGFGKAYNFFESNINQGASYVLEGGLQKSDLSEKFLLETGIDVKQRENYGILPNVPLDAVEEGRINDSDLEKKVKGFLLNPDLPEYFRALEDIIVKDNEVFLSVSNPLILRSLGNGFLKARGLKQEISIKSSYGAFSVYDYLLKDSKNSPGEVIQVILEAQDFAVPVSLEKKDFFKKEDINFVGFKKGDILSILGWDGDLDNKSARDFIKLLSNYNQRIQGEVFLASKNSLVQYTSGEFGNRLYALEVNLANPQSVSKRIIKPAPPQPAPSGEIGGMNNSESTTKPGAPPRKKVGGFKKK